MSNVVAFPFRADSAQDENLIGNTLRKVRKSSKMSMREVVEQLKLRGISVTKTSYNRWELGECSPNGYQMLALFDIFQIKFPMETFSTDPSLNETGLEKLAEYRRLLLLADEYRAKPDEGQTPPDAAGEAVASTRNTSTKKVRKKPGAAAEEGAATEAGAFVYLPIGSLPAAAGPGSYLDYNEWKEKAFPQEVVPSKADFVLRISGDSMEPRYRDGDCIFVEECESMDLDEVGVFAYQGMAYVKVLKMVKSDDEDEQQTPLLYSLNRKRADCDVLVTDLDGLHIFGKVLNKEGFRID